MGNAVVTQLPNCSNGASAIVTATPNAGYQFVNWKKNGNVVSTDAIYTFTVTEDISLVANFEVAPSSFTISASANPAVGGTVSGAGSYNHGANVTLTATANEGYTFINWTENDVEVSTSPNYSFTATADRTLVANFSLNSYAISASANPAVGGTVSGAGEYNHGTNVTLSASANEGYTFVNWTENDVEVSTSPTYSFTASAERTLVANFALNSYTISASANPAVGGTVTGAGSYSHGANVTLAATANEGYTFVNWTENGTQVSTSHNYSFTATADRNLVANFSLNSYTISASANPAVGGTVSGASSYSHGENVTLIATANEGYTFVNWTENDVEISTSPNYSFTATADRNLVANFSLNSYAISASANPAVGGTVSGAGEYNHGANVTLTATANEGYTLVNWTENDVEVSTSPNYSFTATADRTLVANFSLNSYVINASANPAVGGTVSGANTYNHGANVTLTATANEGYTFVNWTENNVEVSTSPTYEFTAIADRNLVANFSEYTNYWTPSMSQFEDNMTLTCIVQFDGVEQRSTALEIGAFCGTDCRGAQRATYFAPTDCYIFQMLVYGEANETISFKLYDHDQSAEMNLTAPSPVLFTTNGYGNLINPYVLNFTSTVSITATANPAGAGQISGAGEYPVGEIATLSATANDGYQFLNWSMNGTVVSTSATYQIEVTGAADYVANFCYKHTQTLAGGWNWWSSYIELTDVNGLTMLENSLGNHGMLIKSRANGYVEAYEFGGTTEWYGTLNSICNEQMYKVRTNATCEAVITGNAAVGENHPITISNGWNWIGYTNRQSMDLDEALGNINPEANDVIKGRTGFSTYYSTGGYNMWYGTLNTLEPGQGYMYFSNSQEQKSLVYSSGRSEAKPNITSESNVFQPNDREFADNMNITAVVEFESEELRSENYEVAAFVNGECRGSVKLLYVEPTDSYIAFLTVFGEDGENLEFRLTDGNSLMMSTDKMNYTVDGVIGSLTAPAVLHFNMTGVMDNGEQTMRLYPNPTNGMVTVEGDNISRVTIVDALGQVVYSEVTVPANAVKLNMSQFNVGLYIVRIATDKGLVTKRLTVIR